MGWIFYKTIRPSSPMWTIQNERTKYRKSPKDWNGQWVKSVNKILYSQLPFITHAGFRKILVRVRSLVRLYRSGEGCTRSRLYCMCYFVVTILERHGPELKFNFCSGGIHKACGQRRGRCVLEKTMLVHVDKCFLNTTALNANLLEFGAFIWILNSYIMNLNM